MADIKFLNNISLENLQLKNAKIQVVSTDPVLVGASYEGRIIYNSNDNSIKFHNGSNSDYWVKLDGVSVDGSGTANYTARWTDSDTLSIGALYDNGTQVGIGTNNPDTPLHVVGNVKIETTGSVDNLLLTSTDATLTGAPDISLFADTAAADGDTIGNIQFRGRNGMVPGSTTPLTYAAFYSHIIDKDNNQSILALTGHKGNGSGANKTVANFSVIGTNNSGEGAVLINPSSGYTPSSYNLEVNGDFKVVDDASFDSNVGVTGSVTATSFIGNLLGNVNGNVNGSLVNGSLSNITGLSVTGTGDSYFAGNLGIGTTNPTNKLHVADTNSAINSKGNLFVATTDAYAKDKGGQISFGGVWNSTPSTAPFAGIAGRKETSSNGNAAGYLQLSTSNSSGGSLSEKMRITSAGNVGIGTTSPGAKLDVSDSIPTIRITGVRSGNWTIGQTMASLEYFSEDTAGTAANSVRASINLVNETTIYGSTTGLAFSTKGNVSGAPSEAVRISASGNVGIGTNSPTERLEVDGNIKLKPYGRSIYFGSTVNEIKGDSSNFIYKSFSKAEWDNAGTYTNSSYVFKQSGSEVFRIDTGGNVGIGTTSPSSKFQVSVNNGDGITLKHGASNAFYILRDGNDDTIIKQTRNYTSKISISTLADSGTHESSGLNIVGQGIGLKSNVGIGTASPSEKLHVVGTGRFTGQVTIPATPIASTDAASKGYVDAQIGTADTLSEVLALGNTTGGTNIDVSPNDVIDFFTGSNLNYGRIHANAEGLNLNTVANRHMIFNKGGTETMRIDTLGNVGIGTSIPSHKLEVVGNISTSTNFIGDNVIVNKITAATSGGDIKFRNNDGVNKVVITNSGNVGIGATSPGALLDVNGTTHLRSVALDTIFGQSGNNINFINTGNTTFNNSNVGIGTTSPAEKLHVNGEVRVDGNDGVATRKIRSSYFSSGQNLDLQSGSSADIILTTRNVGIGTTSPTRKLDVAGDMNLASSAVALRIGGTAVLGLLNNFTRVNGTGGASGGIVFTPNNDNNEKVRITGAGNVGIGTTSPNRTLSVKASSSSMVADFKSVSGNNSYVSFSNNASTADQVRIGSSSSSLVLSTNYTERVRITSDGKVGIGTTSPLAKLQVSSTSGWGVFTERGIKDGSTSTYSHNFGAGNAHILGRETIFESTVIFSTLTADAQTKEYRLQNLSNKLVVASVVAGATTDNNILVISGTNVGIGTTSPVYKLVVNGGARAGGVVTYTKHAGSLTTTGYAVAGLTSSSNGDSTGFTFTCFGHTGGYQKIVYSCRNETGTWKTSKVINEGTNDFDVDASADGTTITFTFKSTSGTKYYSPRVTIEASGHSINSTYA